MTDIAPELYKRIERLYQSGMAANPEIKALRAIERKTYADAQRFAIRAGKNASRALTTVLKPSALPNETMYFNIAERTLRPILSQLYEDVAAFCAEAQLTVNEAAGLGMNAIKPALNDSRISGMINRMTEEVSYDDITWILKAPVVNFSQSVVDDSVVENMRFQSEAGIKPKIVRTTDGNCCEWCSKLAGTYDYPTSNTDIYRRHDNCPCVLTYYPKRGRSESVWGNRMGLLTRRTEERRKQNQSNSGR